MRGTHAPTPVNRMTDACENITLPQTSFTGGKNSTHCCQYLWISKLITRLYRNNIRRKNRRVMLLEHTGDTDKSQLKAKQSFRFSLEPSLCFKSVLIFFNLRCLNLFVTGRQQSGEGNVFSRVCQSAEGVLFKLVQLVQGPALSLWAHSKFFTMKHGLAECGKFAFD